MFHDLFVTSGCGCRLFSDTNKLADTRSEGNSKHLYQDVRHANRRGSHYADFKIFGVYVHINVPIPNRYHQGIEWKCVDWIREA
jgi:hypothetical protein